MVKEGICKAPDKEPAPHRGLRQVKGLFQGPVLSPVTDIVEHFEVPEGNGVKDHGTGDRAVRNTRDMLQFFPLGLFCVR